MNDINQIYTKIDEQRALLANLMASDNPVAPNQLSEVCVKLAVLNELLGGFLPVLKEAQLTKEAAIYKQTKALNGTDTRANAESRLGTLVERKEFETADIKHSDLWKVISMAQSHIKALSTEWMNGGQS